MKINKKTNIIIFLFLVIGMNSVKAETVEKNGYVYIKNEKGVTITGKEYLDAANMESTESASNVVQNNPNTSDDIYLYIASIIVLAIVLVIVNKKYKEIR